MPSSASLTVGLASRWSRWSQLEEATSLLREALQARQAVCGPTHRDTLDALYNLGRLLQDQGQLEEAVALLSKELEGAAERKGADHEETIESAQSLHATLITAGKSAEAATLALKYGLGEDGIYRGAPVDAEKVAAAMGIETKGMDDTMKAQVRIKVRVRVRLETARAYLLTCLLTCLLQVVQLAHDEAELAAAESHDASGGLTVDDDGRILSPDKDPVTKAAGDGGKKLMEMSTEEKASHLEAQKEAAKEKNKEKLAAFQSQRGSGSSREMSAEEKKAMLWV